MTVTDEIGNSTELVIEYVVGANTAAMTDIPKTDDTMMSSMRISVLMMGIMMLVMGALTAYYMRRKE